MSAPAEFATGRCASPGFAPDTKVSPYLKLLPMLAGIGSPGTLQEVRRSMPFTRSTLRATGSRHERAAQPGIDERAPVSVACPLAGATMSAAHTVAVSLIGAVAGDTGLHW